METCKHFSFKVEFVLYLLRVELRQCMVTDESEFLITIQVEQKVVEGIHGKCKGISKERRRGDSCDSQRG
jgi:hypothetical protein